MIKITFPNSENQSAEYLAVVDFYKAIFQSDEVHLSRLVTDDCVYVVHGGVSWEGKSGLAKMLGAMKQSGLDHVSVENVIVDKKHAAINGICTLEEGSKLSFCEFLTFSTEQKIQRVDSYPVAM